MKQQYGRGVGGFTLIELSVVLVIIGLLAGGILAGQSLITASNAHKQLKQIADLEIQINTFRIKYGCLPGDCGVATNFFGTTDANGYTVTNGDGDGTLRSTASATSINDCTSSSIAASELTQLFLQLNDAQLGNYTSDGTTAVAGKGFPLLAINNGAGMVVSCISSPTASVNPKTSLAVGNIIVLGVCPNANTRLQYVMDNAINGGSCNVGANAGAIGIPISMAQFMDQKIDDGLPNTGNFASTASSGSGCYSATNAYSSIPASPGCWIQLGDNGNIVAGKKISAQ